ncbi:MAG: preprotein translocase subunit YajC [Victivallales bacterium]|nr:preprotein translocase subunit YajC [Victivallales bacterium]
MNSITSLIAANSQNAGGLKGLLVSFGPFILIIVVMYFLLFRSQRKKNQQRQKMLDSMRAGDKVITAGGVMGTITKLEEKVVKLKIAENVVIEVSRSSVNGIIEKKSE